MNITEEEFENDFEIIFKARDKFDNELKSGGGDNQKLIAMKLALEYFKIKLKQKEKNGKY